MSDPPLRVVRADELAARPERPRWLVKPLCPHPSVIIAGAQPKSNKTWLSLDLAVSVASATLCLGHFPVDLPGLALIYLAEDSLPDVKTRLECLCKSRGLELGQPNVHVITEPAIRRRPPAKACRRRSPQAPGSAECQYLTAVASPSPGTLMTRPVQRAQPLGMQRNRVFRCSLIFLWRFLRHQS